MISHCPGCQSELEYDDDSIGLDTVCPSCGKTIRLMADPAQTKAPAKPPKAAKPPPKLAAPPTWLRSPLGLKLYDAGQSGLAHRIFGGLIIGFCFFRMIFYESLLNTLRFPGREPGQDIRLIFTLILMVFGCSLYVAGYLIAIRNVLLAAHDDRP